ncbi:unnamed protein product [Cuscuta campestris]|uniref:Response regulatory domain-containing protein n=1 Tax=Cuscuta campestris TaxID=132261 RepID=A0A484LA44_9ASTE|nr:unnamed protein product [Cuscuta campestris]
MAAAGKADAVVAVPEHFPVGLRVLVVDDDVVWLKIIEQMLRKCSYNGLFLFHSSLFDQLTFLLSNF